MPELERSINQLNHSTLLANQLVQELHQLHATVILQTVDTESEPVTQQLQPSALAIHDQLVQLRPAIDNITLIVQQLRNATAQQDTNLEHINQLHTTLTQAVAQIRPQLALIQQLVAELLQLIRQIIDQINNDMLHTFNRLTPAQKAIINNIINGMNLSEQVQLGRQSMQNNLDQLRRNDLSEAESLLRTQLTHQIRVFTSNNEQHLQALQTYRLANQHIINSNENMTQYLQYDHLKRRLQEIISNYSQLFQQAEIIAQQIVLIEAAPEGHQLFPKVTNGTFWSHVYRRVAVDPQRLNSRVHFHPSIPQNFSDLDVSRKIAGSEEYNYAVPVLDQLHIEVSHLYGTTVIQNVVMHLLCTRLWIMRISKGYFLSQQQQLGRLPIMALARKAADGIISHRQFQEIVFQDQDEEDVEEEIPAFVNLDQLYNSIRLIYEADFANTDYEQVNNYENASNHPFKYLRVSYRLLQVASSLPDLPIKLWSLIPQGSHSIVHVPLSGMTTLYHLFKKAHENHLPVPGPFLRNGVFIPQIDFQVLYSIQADKRNLWNAIFDLRRIEHAGMQLAFGLKTDGHMISILFEKAAINRVPQNQKETAFQKTRKNINNWTKGLYPLYKNPFGITENDRIIGIDPGVRDIVCGVDCDAQQLTNKQTTKQHSFAVSNASYKLRSGMAWIQQKELKSRAQSNIQASYDRLQSRKVCTNEGVMQFLNSFASERTRIHDFMRAYCHRENKGYTYSDRKMAQDYVARVVLGRTKVGEDFKLAHSSSKSARKRRRRRYRAHFQDQLRPANDTRRTVVAYGDASIRGTYRGNTPIPVKQIQRAIAEKAIVIPVDEFRTSVTCCHCQQRLDLVRAPMFVCNHRKKKHRSGGFDGNMFESRSTVKCYDEENHILHRTSQCPERRMTGNRAIYPLKLCPQCPANNNNGLFWNRDVNAATNIRSILVEYIRSGYVLESRPAALTRGRQDKGL